MYLFDGAGNELKSFLNLTGPSPELLKLVGLWAIGGAGRQKFHYFISRIVIKVVGLQTQSPPPRSRAVRNDDWEMHLNALGAFVNFSFAFDKLNFARMTPIYLSEIYSPRGADPILRNEFGWLTSSMWNLVPLVRIMRWNRQTGE